MAFLVPDAQYEREYAYYTEKLAQQQLESNATDDWLGHPRTDLAHAKAMERAEKRALIAAGGTGDWAHQQRKLRESIDRKAYARAIGVEL